MNRSDSRPEIAASVEFVNPPLPHHHQFNIAIPPLPMSLGESLIYALCLLLLLLVVHRRRLSRPIHPKGFRRLGLPPEQSNLRDEYDAKYSHGEPSSPNNLGCPRWRVKALFSYPIKSCAGIELQVADVVRTGLAFDRMFAFAERTEDDWACRTLRNKSFNKLALILPEIWVPDPSPVDYDPKSHGIMVVSYPRPLPAGHRGLLVKWAMALRLYSRQLSFQVPLDAPADCPLVPVKVWKDQPLSYDYGRYLPESLHLFLGNSRVSLFRASTEHCREIFRNAPPKESLGFQAVTSFADAYPIHLLSISSHRDVAARCGHAIPRLTIRRFRANIIIQGPTAFAEDGWKRILLGSTETHAVCRTVRCLLPNVDPDTGDRHPFEPDRTLKSYRCVDAGAEKYACLGMQLVPAVPEFTVSVGDPVHVLETGEHYYIKMLIPGERVPGV